MTYNLIVCGLPGSILTKTLLNVVKSLESDNVTVEYVDIESNLDYVYKYTIRNSPTLLVFKNGELWKQMNLPINKENILV